MKIGVVTFPGSNCDRDCVHFFSQELGLKTQLHWYQDLNLKGYDLVILPGGFSYGDYLRSGAIAAVAPILNEIKKFSGWVLGICNGFQILTEAKILPGALTHNSCHHFLCQSVEIEAQKSGSPWMTEELNGHRYRFPIAHADGRFVAAPEILKSIEGEGQVAWRYTQDINGSMNRIAGLAKGRVLGMMPHPERHPDGQLWLKHWLDHGAQK